MTAGYDKIFSEKQYVNQAARKEIVKMIKRTLKDYAGKNFLMGDEVTNASFREYAAKTGKGADFLVYSDIKITTLQTVEKVVLSP